MNPAHTYLFQYNLTGPIPSKCDFMGLAQSDHQDCLLLLAFLELYVLEDGSWNWRCTIQINE